MKGNNILENLENCLQNYELKYDVVAITEFLLDDEVIKIDLFCRNNKMGFICTTLLGI